MAPSHSPQSSIEEEEETKTSSRTPKSPGLQGIERESEPFKSNPRGNEKNKGLYNTKKGNC